MVSAWDVADACVLAARTPGTRGAVLNLGSEGTVTVRGQVDRLIAHAGSPSRVVPLPAGLVRTGARTLGLVGLSPIVPEHYLLADTTFVLDTTRARSLLGWQPRFDDVSLMTEAYDWFAAHADAVAPRRSPIVALLDALS
jgi:nucleoside-diphosphate-sugar epimerase